MQNNLKTNYNKLSLYIHIPWCIKKCPYCDFNSHQIPKIKSNNNSNFQTVDQNLKQYPDQFINKELENNYLEQLLLDLDNTLLFLDSNNYPPLQDKSNLHISTIFIGGGTPSLMSPDFYTKLLDQINNRITLSSNTEITIEANPASISQNKNDISELSNHKLKLYKNAGINRLSIGVQSFDNNSLKYLGRVHDYRQAIETIETANLLGFNYNIDLMHSLPRQTVDSALLDIKTAIDLQPNHISWYQLTIEPNTEFYTVYNKNSSNLSLPDDDTQSSIFLAGSELLNQNNYQQYEISAYSLNNNYQCKHNLNYWRFGDYIGIGAGAHSKFDNKKSIIRQWKQKSPIRYLDNNKYNKISGQSIELKPNKTILLEYMMNKLRLFESITEKDFYYHTNFNFDNIISLIKQAENKKWLQFQQSQLKITDEGYRFLDDLVLLFA